MPNDLIIPERRRVAAIETRYKNYRFRSRLEARWAIYLDAIGASWNYEPEGFRLMDRLYLPDFYVSGINVYIEIKPLGWDDDDLQYLMQGFGGSIAPIILCCGDPGTNESTLYCLETDDGGGGNWDSPVRIDSSPDGPVLCVIDTYPRDRTLWRANFEEPMRSYEFFTDFPPRSPVDIKAERKALSARFEHGEYA